ncbi:Inner membrane protein yjeO [Yersinia pekkanenii]|uniref:Inner membrane protein yjeO n=1 Tax=Yersinia pekkanenii TaxID=1288385 RepID=A0A0T9PTI0_9GAMM|nr:DUF2645 family protein [Yersinia pekkanenii]CNH81254.1 Inner membrane protein yjeO [Yersinia pekkanenii]
MREITPLSIIVVIYVWFLIFSSLISSSFNAESFIDGDEIKNICDVIKVFVVDDYRSVMAIAILLAIIPVVIYCIMTKFKGIIINISIAAFALSWIFLFVVKFRDCPWF